MKQRITSLDLKILTHELQGEILEYRLLNIYNAVGSHRQYVFKFAVPDSKKALVLDCGNKLYLTSFERPTAPAPSLFVTKLRKHLKTRRLSLLKQVGNDRVLVMLFSSGLFYLVFEFFSAGNILLLDHDRKILALHRMVVNPNVDKYAVGEPYNMFDESLFDEEPQLQDTVFAESQILDWAKAHKEVVAQSPAEKKKKVFSIHKLLFVNASYLSNDLLLKTLARLDVPSSTSCLSLLDDQDLLKSTVGAVNATQEAYDKLLQSAKEGSCIGTIVERKNPTYNSEDKDSLAYIFDEFHPFQPLKPTPDFQFKPIEGYNKTLDEFFSTIESTKHSLRLEQQKQHAEKRLNTAKNERNKQIQLLQTQQLINEQKGNMIIFHAELVEQCKDYVQSMLNKQMDWTDIENIVKLDASKARNVASHFRLPLNLLQNKIKLALPDTESMVDDEGHNDASADDQSLQSESSSDSSSESESDSSSDSDSDLDSDIENVRKAVKQSRIKKPRKPSVPTVNVEIDLTLSAFANARLYFDSKKMASNKQAKVEVSSQMALRNAEKKIQRDLARNLKNEVDALRSIRSKYWFEKYFYFFTSDNFLCLAGRDDAQTDMIYYRHFSDNGYFVSSDIEGSLSVFILNPFVGEEVSPAALWQAGTFAMLSSTAWNGKVTSSAWWLKGLDVTKKEYDGSLLGPGRLNFKAKKNYMPPSQLVMGFGLYLLGDEDTTARYKKSREDKLAESGLKIEMNNIKKDLEGMTIAAKAEQPLVEETVPESVPAPTESAEELSASSSVTSLPLPPQKLTRGKKSKMKKINQKYADQDEEERQLRMEALGTLKQIQQNEKEAIEAAKTKADAEKHKYAMANRGAERDRKAEERELQKYLNGGDNEDTELYLEVLDSLIAKPASQDVLVGAVPVFGPWTSMARFKYKTKVQPGMGKKGKAITDSLSYFANRKIDAAREDTDQDWADEHDIINTLKSNDMIGVLTANKVKLVLPGGNANDKAQKKGGKKGKR